MLNSNIRNKPTSVDKSVEKVDNSPIQEQSSSVLGVLAKAPIAGKVKTRLCPPLQPEQATALYRTLLDETLRRFSGQSFELVICYAGKEDYFADNYPQLARQPQQGKDLGERMENALQSFLAAGYSRAILIGSDSPDLPISHVEQAFDTLRQAEVVIAPAEDGGYVLIGESSHHPLLFESMPWSQGQLMQQTKRVLAEQQIDWQQLPDWEDVDDIASLLRLARRSPESLTASYVKTHLALPRDE